LKKNHRAEFVEHDIDNFMLKMFEIKTSIKSIVTAALH